MLFFTLWVRSDKSVVANQPQVGWCRLALSAWFLHLPCLPIEPLGGLLNLPMNESKPNTVLENQGLSWSNPKIRGESAPPTRAQLEQKPTAELRTHVGYSSAEKVYMIEKVAATANFPTKAITFEVSSIISLHSVSIWTAWNSQPWVVGSTHPEFSLHSMAVTHEKHNTKNHSTKLRRRPQNLDSEYFDPSNLTKAYPSYKEWSAVQKLPLKHL